MAGRKKEPIDHDQIVRRFGERLREVRSSRGLTQGDLAERSGVSMAYVGRLERGGAAAGIDLVAKLAAALGVRPAELLPDADRPDPRPMLREQAKALFEGLLQSEDEGMLQALSILLARLSASQKGTGD